MTERVKSRPVRGLVVHQVARYARHRELHIEVNNNPHIKRAGCYLSTSYFFAILLSNAKAPAPAKTK